MEPTEVSNSKFEELYERAMLDLANRQIKNLTVSAEILPPIKTLKVTLLDGASVEVFTYELAHAAPLAGNLS